MGAYTVYFECWSSLYFDILVPSPLLHDPRVLLYAVPFLHPIFAYAPSLQARIYLYPSSCGSRDCFCFYVRSRWSFITPLSQYASPINSLSLNEPLWKVWVYVHTQVCFVCRDWGISKPKAILFSQLCQGASFLHKLTEALLSLECWLLLLRHRQHSLTRSVLQALQFSVLSDFVQPHDLQFLHFICIHMFCDTPLWWRSSIMKGSQR